MLAACFREPGDPSVLRVESVATPAPPTGDRVLVRVEASSVNGTDLGLRRGDFRLATLGRMPFVPGFDLAGRVVACGPEVTAFRPDDRVMGLLGHSGGGQAEYVVCRQRRLARAPASVSSVQAAALPLAGLTALQALHGLAALHTRRRPRVLVNGATGGVGSYGVQLAKLAGAHVTAVASGPKLTYARELGADEVVDYRVHDVAELGERWDVVLDAAARLSFSTARRALVDDGVLVSTRALSADTLRALAPRGLRRGPGRHAAVMTRARSQDLAHLAAMVDGGLLRPTLTREFPLAEVADAHRHAEGPTAQGKTVVVIP